MVRKLLLCLIALCFLAANRPDAPQTRAKTDKIALEPDNNNDISGYYTCKGTEVGGKHYSGVTVITKKNDVYIIQWVIGGGSTFLGVGVRQGQTLAASWAMAGDKGQLIRGVNVYKIETGPRLVGRWATIPGPGVQQSETLTFLKNLDAEKEE